MQMVNPGGYTRTKFHYLKMSQLPSDNSTCHSCVCDDVGVQIYSLGSGSKSRGRHDEEKYPIWKNKNLLFYVFFIINVIMFNCFLYTICSF